MKDNLDRIKKVLKKSTHIAFGYLFGSKAKGLADVRSDWDIAVYFDKEVPGNWLRFYLEAEIEREIKEDVQITVLNNIEDPVFAFEIVSNSILLIDRKPETRILFEAGALRRYHDWNYYLRSRK